jgi:hypothetical protein
MIKQEVNKSILDKDCSSLLNVVSSDLSDVINNNDLLLDRLDPKAARHDPLY